jgi:hypothetical protein
MDRYRATNVRSRKCFMDERKYLFDDGRTFIMGSE